MIDDTPDLDPHDIATAGEYVLGTLPLAEREPFQRRLLSEPALVAEVARFNGFVANGNCYNLSDS